ncbi:hypothetical protein KEJ50_06620 [Candidatus Bathyarchaeota archaeon]|nr:hypothetical protein [Candidatus Bathyarchaeota archaeon]
MLQIAESHGVKIYVNKDNFLSFTNSPYYAHKKLSAIDIYPPRGCREALSPIEGKTSLIKVLKEDYVIIIKVNEEACIKILHVKPKLKVGDKVYPGDFIGEIIWSPFYNFWTDYHAHIEVRPIKDPLRAKGGYELNISPLLSKTKINESFNRFFRVEEVNKRYILLKNQCAQNFFASSLSIKIFEGCLEGGFFHYGHGALITLKTLNFLTFKEGNSTKLTFNSFEAIVDYIKDTYIHFIFEKKPFLINNEKYKGLSVYINDKFLKLIPIKPGETKIKEGDEISLPFLNNLINCFSKLNKT